MDIILKYFSDFTTKQLEQFKALDELYKDWNSKINVISRKDIEGLYEKHVLHSLSIAAVFDFEPGAEIIDIGTGGGFPGIPLAIYFPEVRFHLVDSIAKKLKVVQGIADAIGLGNISTQHIRAEEIKNRKFDFAISRAVAPLKELWKWSRPLLKNSLQSAVSSSQSLVSQQPANPTHHSPLTTHPGLLCLKGGELAQEIKDSGAKPRIISISEIFPESFFEDKYLLYTSR